MSDYNSNYEIAQAISERIGVEPIPFDSVYSIALQIYNELGGEPSEFDSVYEILLGILPLVEGGIASKVIDDSVITTNKTWSSSKINEEIQAIAGTANSVIEGSATLVYNNSMSVTGISDVTFNGYTESDLLNMNDAKVRISFDMSMGGSTNGTITQSGFLSKFVMSMGDSAISMLMLTFGFMDISTQTYKILYMVYDTSLQTPAWSVQLK